MPLKVPHHSVTVQRNGVNVTPPRGTPFDFSADEIKQVQASHPYALRDPKNENVAITETDLLRGKELPEDADTTVDANIMGKTKAKAGGVARNQGGSLEDGKVASGGKSLKQEEDDEL